MARTMAIACFLAGLTPCLMAADHQPASGSQAAEHMQRTVVVTMNYLLYLPENYDQQEKWPLVLFLHGAGERGDNLDLVKIHGPPKLIAAGKQFPAIIVSPQCPKDQYWSVFHLDALLNEIEENYNVDPDRLYVTGLSMGGFGTWALASQYPKRFAAILAICGGGEPGRAKAIKDLPIWVVHGKLDKSVPFERSEQMVEALKKQKADVHFTVYPEGPHDVWTQTYEDPAVWEWLFAQRRSTEATE